MPEDRLAELMILVEAVGVDKAIQSLEKAEKGLGNTAKKAKSDTKALEQFGSKFAGAMAIITASIAGAVGALLVQMPIMQEIFDALAYLIETLAYVMDGILRPVLDKVVDGIYWLANKFEELPKPVQVAIVAIIIIVGVLAALVAIALVVIAVVVSIIGGIASLVVAVGGGVAAFMVIAIVIGGTVALLGALAITIFLAISALVAIALGIAGVVLAVLIWIKIIKTLIDVIPGVFNRIKEVIGDFMDATVALFILGFEQVKDLFLGLKDMAVDAVKGIAKDIWDAIGLEDKFKTGLEAVKTVINGFVSFFKGIGSSVADVFKGIANTLIDTLNKAIDAINAISVDIPDWVPVYGGKKFSLNIPKIPSLKTQGIIEQTGIAEVHEGEGVFAMRTLQDAMYNAMVMAGLDRAKDVNVYLDGHLVGRIMGDELNRDFGAQGGGF